MKLAQRALLLFTGLLLGLLAAGLIELVRARPRGTPIELLPLPTQAPLRVYVSGAVLRPGIYSLAPGSIVQDAIDLAGGPLPEALLENHNLAAPVWEGQQIHIGTLSEDTPIPAPLATALQTPSKKININTADALELDSLPGIGPSLAAKIIEYRQKNGPFNSVEDLLLVSGIGPAKLSQIKDLIIIR
jgi:competence protein ComEA